LKTFLPIKSLLNGHHVGTQWHQPDKEKSWERLSSRDLNCQSTDSRLESRSHQNILNAFYL